MSKTSSTQTTAVSLHFEVPDSCAGPQPALDEALAGELHRHVLAFFRRRVSNAVDAEDLVQDTMLRMVRSLKDLRSKDRLHPWLFRIAHSVLADYWQSRSRAPETELDTESLADADLTSAHATKELAGCLRLFVDRLPGRYRETVELSEIEELPHREIAQRLGLSISGVKSRVQRGREQLRHLVLGCCAVDFYGGEVRTLERKPDRGGEPCGCGEPASAIPLRIVGH